MSLYSYKRSSYNRHSVQEYQENWAQYHGFMPGLLACSVNVVTVANRLLSCCILLSSEAL
jgi:hypothetical protein